MSIMVRCIVWICVGLIALSARADEWENSPFCWKESYGRGVGTIPTKAPDCPKGSFYDPYQSCWTCPSGKPRTLFYPVDHTTMACGNIFTGYAKATKVKDVNVCGAGKTLNAGLCYPACRTGHVGVGPVCWANCPASHPTPCGMGCAKSKLFCDQAITEQVLSVVEGAVEIAGAIVSGGSSELLVAAGGNVLSAGSDIAADKFAKAAEGFADLTKGLTVEQATEVLIKLGNDGGQPFTRASARAVAEWLIRMRDAPSEDVMGQLIEANGLIEDTAGLTGLDDLSVVPFGTLMNLGASYIKPICGGSGYVPETFIAGPGSLMWRDGGINAIDVAVDMNSRPWVLATNPPSGAGPFNSTGLFYQLENKSWKEFEVRLPFPKEQAYRLDVGSQNDPWVITLNGQLWHYVPARKVWEQVTLPKKARALDLYVSKDPRLQEKIYVVSALAGDKDSRGNMVFYKVGASGGWNAFNRGAAALADWYDSTFVVDHGGRIDQFFFGRWRSTAIPDTRIRAIAQSSGFVVATDTKNNIYYSAVETTGTSWKKSASGKASRVAVQGNDNIWVVGEGYRVHQGGLSGLRDWSQPASSITFDPYKAESGPLKLMHCNSTGPVDIVVTTYNSNDGIMLAHYQQAGITRNYAKPLKCATSSCKLKIGGLTTGALSGYQVYVGGKVRATNKIAIDRGCEAFK